MEIVDGELRPGEAPTPVPGPGEVLIEVHAAGVNRADLLQVAGHYPPPPGAPDHPGLEVAGRVIAVGSTVPEQLGPILRRLPGPQPGDRVAALLAGGGYASHVVVNGAHTFPIPEHLSFTEAAALPEALATVWSSLARVGDAPTGDLRAGETLLVIGGSGGIGTMAVQVGKLLGARVVATAGGAERCAAVAALGADVVLDHRTHNPAELTTLLREATDGWGADVILDVLGGATLGENVRRLAVGGRLSLIGTQAGRRGEVDVLALMSRRARILGATLRARPESEKAAIMADVAANLLPHLMKSDHRRVVTGNFGADDGGRTQSGKPPLPRVTSGDLHPVVEATLPLEEAAQAHRMLRDGEVFGKVVLVP